MRNMKLVVAAAAIMVLAAAGVGNAQMGVGVMWTSDGVPDVMTLPIMFGEGMVLQPMVGFISVSDGASYSEFHVGASFEKQMREGTSPLFGGRIMVEIGSPDEGDGWTNFGIGAFLGGTASLADNLDIVGTWGPMLTMYAEESPVYTDATVISSQANITLRWWVFGE
jgi:hypothetical protein